MQDRPAQRLGNYHLLHLLGTGGFANVYLAEHIYLKTQVAVKVLHARLLERDAHKFLNEAYTVAHLQHPHIVRVLEYGVEDKQAFLVMDYAPHGTLRERYPEGTPQPLQTVLPVIKQMASALKYAHDQHLIHRDVKPENMLVGRDQIIWLSDFGLAIVARSTLSQSRQEALGTIAYMAPEQIRGRPHPASDQYALAAVVYEWLCGSPPFDGDSAITVALQHISEPPPLLRARLSTISPAIEAIVLQGLAKDPHARFDTIQDFAQALEDASLNRFIMPSISSPVLLTDAPLERRLDPAPTSEHRISRRAWLIGGIGGLGLLAAGGVGAAFSLHRNSTLVGSLVSTPEPTSAPTLGPTAAPSPVYSPVPTATPLPGTLFTYRGNSGPVYNVAWSPDNKMLASCDAQVLQVWDALSGNHIMKSSVRYSNEAISGVAWSSDSKALAFATGTGSVYVLSVPAGTTLALHSHNNLPGIYGGASSLSLAWSPDGQYLASGGVDSSNAVRVWNAFTNILHLTYKGHGTGPGFAAQPSSSITDTILSWLSGGNGIASTNSGQGYVNPIVAWSPDGKYLASGGDDAVVEVWDSSTGATLSSYQGHNSQSSIQSPQIQQAALPAFLPHDPFSGGAPGQITAVSWSPDSASVASSSADATVQISDAASGTQTLTYGNHIGAVHMVAYSPDGKMLASCGDDGTVQVWKAPGS